MASQSHSHNAPPTPPLPLFGERLADAVDNVGVPVAVGLDPHLNRLPRPLQAQFQELAGAAFREAAAKAVERFNELAIRAVRGKVAAIKPQFAFYEALGAPGWAALEKTCAMAKDAGLLIIGDAKRGDISSTAAAYAQAILSPDGPLGCDAITLNPWMGSDTLSPFVSVCQDHGRGLFALVRTTNPGSALLQHHGTPTAAHHLANTLHNLGTDLCGPRRLSAVGAVVGASAADEAKVLRQLMPEAWFLVPGIGAQGGSADQALAGCRKDGMGALPVASRSVLFPNKPSVSYDTDPEGFIASQVDVLTEQVREVWQ